VKKTVIFRLDDAVQNLLGSWLDYPFVLWLCCLGDRNDIQTVISHQQRLFFGGGEPGLICSDLRKNRPVEKKPKAVTVQFTHWSSVWRKSVNKKFYCSNICMSFLNCPVFEIKLLTKLQFSDNILFKLFSRNISEDLANLTDVAAAMYWNVRVVCFFVN